MLTSEKPWDRTYRSLVECRSPLNVLRLGISIDLQHLGLVPSLSVAENILLGRMPTTKYGLVD